MSEPCQGVLIHCHESTENGLPKYEPIYGNPLRFVPRGLPAFDTWPYQTNFPSPIGAEVGLPMLVYRTNYFCPLFPTDRERWTFQNDAAAKLVVVCNPQDPEFGQLESLFGCDEETNPGTVVVVPEHGWQVKPFHVEALCEFAGRFMTGFANFYGRRPTIADKRDAVEDLLSPEHFKEHWLAFRARKAEAAVGGESERILGWRLPRNFPIGREP